MDAIAWLATVSITIALVALSVWASFERAQRQGWLLLLGGLATLVGVVAGSGWVIVNALWLFG